MAEGARLATGWLELTVSTAGAQQSMVSEITGAGVSAGNGLGASLLGTVKKYAAPLAAAFGIGKAISTGFAEVKDAQAVTAQLAAGIASTGNAANVSVEGLNNLASSIQATTGQTDDSIGAAQGLLLTFTNIRNVGVDNIFDQATQAAADMAARMGGDAASKATMLGKALNDPVKGVTALTKVGVQFTEQQKSQIAAMVAAGDTLGAQKVILAELNTQFGGSAAAFGQTLPGQLERAKRGFEDFTQTAVGAITPLAGPVLELLIGGLARVTDAIAPMASTVGPVLQSVFGQIGATIGPILSQLLPPVLQLWQAFSPLGLILGALTPVLPQLAGLLGQLGETIGGALGQALTTLMPPLVSVAGVLSGALSQAFLALMPAVSALIPVIMQIVEVVAGTLGTALTGLTPIMTLIADLFASLLPTIMPLITAVVGLVEPLGQLLLALAPIVGIALPPLVQLLGAVLPPVLALIQPLIGLLVPALTLVADVLATVIGWVAQAIGWFLKFVTGNQEAGAQFQAVWSNIMSFFQGVGQFIGDVWNGMISGISSFVGQVIGFFQSIPQKVGEIFAGAGRWLYDAGKNIIDGLINGARSILVNLGNFFLDIVPDWIKAPFKAALGINSPSRVFHEYGDNTIQGYIDGVKARRADLQREVGGSAPTAWAQSTMTSDRIAESVAAAIAAHDLGGVMITGPVTAFDPEEVGIEIQKRRQRAARRTGALRTAMVR
ncbi:phage tail length tape measure family protein [Microbacterium sp. 179-I 3D2 NHS]|uniref:phage tail protein n=1 Tax=Microbacterium sp. 179-I 3D2 NHS TaxID=3235178 RepID=UPI00399EEBC0